MYFALGLFNGALLDHSGIQLCTTWGYNYLAIAIEFKDGKGETFFATLMQNNYVMTLLGQEGCRI